MLIMAFTSFLISRKFSGMQLVVMIFFMITAAFMMSYFRMGGALGRKVNIALEIIISIAAIVFPEAAMLLPITVYEILSDRQIAAGLISFAGIAFSAEHFEPDNYVLFVIIIILSLYISYVSGKQQKLEKDNKKIRDEGEVQKEKLRSQNRTLLNEQDKNIYLAQLSERNRIAREIHDNVGHMLSRSLLQVGAMMVVHKNEPVSKELSSLRETLDTAMNNIRESVHDIRDESIDVEEAVKEMAEPLKNKYNVRFDCDISGRNMPKEIKYATINIIKEALSNISKYSHNSNVDINIEEHPVMYKIVIHDYEVINENEPGEAREVSFTGNGMGLDNIRTRAEQLGGQALFTNNNGFRVFVRIPKN